MAVPLSDEELLARFLDASLPADAFHHGEHVRVAWLFVVQYGMPTALIEFPVAIKRFALAKGATTLYHETITWAFLLIIHERQQRLGAKTWSVFAAAHPDLLTWKPSVLDQFYTAETLWSEFARQTFVWPDRTRST
jgi:hypothetical protein